MGWIVFLNSHQLPQAKLQASTVLSPWDRTGHRLGLLWISGSLGRKGIPMFQGPNQWGWFKDGD